MWNQTSDVYYFPGGGTNGTNPYRMLNLNNDFDGSHYINDNNNEIMDNNNQNRQFDENTDSNPIVTSSSMLTQATNFPWFSRPPLITQFSQEYYNQAELYVPNVQCQQLTAKSSIISDKNNKDPKATKKAEVAKTPKPHIDAAQSPKEKTKTAPKDTAKSTKAVPKHSKSPADNQKSNP